MKYLYLLFFILVSVLLTAFVINAPQLVRAATAGEPSGQKMLNELPLGFNDLFAGSGECVMCHSNLISSQGANVSITNDWRSTMMANSAKDPFWRAKVSHETLVNPDHAEVLEDVCTRCHAPMGHFNAHYGGQELYSIEEMEADALALDGVSCTVCHQIPEESLGNFSGGIVFGDDQTIWGPYQNPFPNPMINHTGYTPEYGEHIKDSRVCASCHTLITNTVDLSGIPTGTEFVEQAIYHEWKNSVFSATDISCQTCHIPEITDDVVISTMPPWLEARSPFGLHQLVGANVFMLRMMRDNIDLLGITATVAQFDTTIARAQSKLQQQSLMLDVIEENRTEDTLFLRLDLQNIAGHKFPSGYPSRRVVVSVEVLNQEGATLFHSGAMDEHFNLIHEDEGYEVHHNTITSEEQVQVYELVMGNVNSEPTTVLEQAASALKDNRLPPVGFTAEHPAYDTVAIQGNALLDPDFNVSEAGQGSGKDLLHFHIPVNGSTGELDVVVRVYYQTVTDKWLDAMFAFTSDEIDAFKALYDDADKTPVLVAEKILSSVALSTNDIPADNFMLTPNPAGDFIHIQGFSELSDVRFYGIDGRYLAEGVVLNCSVGCFKLRVPDTDGFALIRFKDEAGIVHSRKLLLK